MAKSRKAKAKTRGGPFLAAAFFCETTIEDKQDGAVSAIRMFDQLAVNVHGFVPPNSASEEHGIPVQVSGLVSFKSGDSPGDHEVRLKMESPSGKSRVVYEQTLRFTDPPHGGANIRINSLIRIKKGGLFWMQVFLDDRLVTLMPLQISVQQAAPPSDVGHSENPTG